MTEPPNATSVRAQMTSHQPEHAVAALRVGVIAEQLHRRPAGGIGVYLRSLVAALARVENLSTSLVLSGGRTPDALDWVPAGVHLRRLLTPHRMTVELVHRGLPVPGAARAVRGLSVLHASSLDTLPGRNGHHAVRTAFVHDTLWRSWPETYSARGIDWHERALRRVTSQAQLVMVPSETVRVQLMADGVAHDRVCVVGEGADHLPLLPRTASADGAGRYLLSVATTQPRKNLVGLLEGYRAYRSQAVAAGDVPATLRLVGPAGWGPELPALPDGVEVVGVVSDDRLASLYAGAAALVFVPLGEGYGLPVAEAWRAHTPVICSTAVPVAAGHADAVVSVSEPQDPQAVAAAVHELLGDPRGTDARVERGRAVAATLTWDEVARRHVSIWRRLTGES